MAKLSVESLIAAFSNDKVIEALGKVLQPLIQLSFDEKLHQKWDSIQSGLESLKTELKLKHDQVQQLTKHNHDLTLKVQNQAITIERLEAYNRQENLIIQGLPHSYAQAAGSATASAVANDDVQRENSTETEQMFLQMCNDKLKLSIDQKDISICHRLPKTDRQEYPPVVVRFTNSKARAAVFGARKKLWNVEGNKIFINEHLTRQARKLFGYARKLLKERKISQVWTTNGQAFVKKLDGSKLPIVLESDLAHL